MRWVSSLHMAVICIPQNLLQSWEDRGAAVYQGWNSYCPMDTIKTWTWIGTLQPSDDCSFLLDLRGYPLLTTLEVVLPFVHSYHPTERVWGKQVIPLRRNLLPGREKYSEGKERRKTWRWRLETDTSDTDRANKSLESTPRATIVQTMPIWKVFSSTRVHHTCRASAVAQRDTETTFHLSNSLALCLFVCMFSRLYFEQT